MLEGPKRRDRVHQEHGVGIAYLQSPVRPTVAGGAEGLVDLEVGDAIEEEDLLSVVFADGDVVVIGEGAPDELCAVNFGL